jgi:uncharacterized membrane protein
MNSFQIASCAVFCAIVTFAKIASYIIPPLRTMVALIIIAGFSFGSFNACVIATVSVLVSGCFLGHGLWTPFQIFGLAIIGLISGILSKNETIIKNKFFLCFWSTLCVLVYSIVMTGYFILSFKINITDTVAFIAYMIYVLKKDIIHLIVTIFTVIFLCEPIQKISNKSYNF